MSLLAKLTTSDFRERSFARCPWVALLKDVDTRFFDVIGFEEKVRVIESFDHRLSKILLKRISVDSDSRIRAYAAATCCVSYSEQSVLELGEQNEPEDCIEYYFQNDEEVVVRAALWMNRHSKYWNFNIELSKTEAYCPIQIRLDTLPLSYFIAFLSSAQCFQSWDLLKILLDESGYELKIDSSVRDQLICAGLLNKASVDFINRQYDCSSRLVEYVESRFLSGNKWILKHCVEGTDLSFEIKETLYSLLPVEQREYCFRFRQHLDEKSKSDQELRDFINVLGRHEISSQNVDRRSLRFLEILLIVMMSGFFSTLGSAVENVTGSSYLLNYQGAALGLVVSTVFVRHINRSKRHRDDFNFLMYLIWKNKEKLGVNIPLRWL